MPVCRRPLHRRLNARRKERKAVLLQLLQEEKEAEERNFKMTDYLTRVCPNCGGRLCVNSSDPDRVYCDTCEYEENAEYVKLSTTEEKQ